MISVILPIYNAEKSLHCCIESILAQNYTDFELLLIDDGSTDGSGLICDEYANIDTRVRVFHKKNGGVSSARNLGLDNARGEWVTFCDADDYVMHDWLSCYENSMSKGVDLAIQGFYSINESGDIRLKKIPENVVNLNSSGDKRGLIVSLMEQGVYGYLWVKLFRREVIDLNRVRFDIKSAFCEDEQFLSKFLEYAEKIELIDKENYYYFLPPSGKEYVGNDYYSLLPIFKSLDVIFGSKLPEEICRMRYVSIKDYAVQNILQGKRLSSYHLNLYRRVITVLDYTKGLKHLLLNTLILGSRVHPGLSKMALQRIHKYTLK